MVFYFRPRNHGPGRDDYLMYMGKDKFENEDLIAHSLPCDIWFHVDNLSSAHVYLRLPEGKTMEDIPEETLEDACQLVKANSIQGNKVSKLAIVYTPASNLKKSGNMVIGQVGFHNDGLVKTYRVEKRVNEIVNRLNKTKEELYPDLEAEKVAWLQEERRKAKREAQKMQVMEKQQREEQLRMKEMMSYDRILVDEAMQTQSDLKKKYASAEDYEDDFM